MRAKGVVFCLVSFFLFSFLIGCKTMKPDIKVRTYTVEEPRVDQNLTQGNRGYLMGSPKDTDRDKNRKTTRTKCVAEIEFGSTVKKRDVEENKIEVVDLEVTQEPDNEYLIEETDIEEVDDMPLPVAQQTVAKKYTVEKNDTLQKISMKFYGTTKKWQKIYDANKEKLKTPDRIYKGQILDIPQD